MEIKFGERLASCMKEQSLSQEALAKAVGITRQAISSYIRGERTPTIKLLYQLCEVLEVSADYLIGRSDIKKRAEEDAKIIEELQIGYSGLRDALRSIAGYAQDVLRRDPI